MAGSLGTGAARTERGGGFTLVELLVVIIIIGLLAGLAIPNFMGYRQKVKIMRARIDFMDVIAQCHTFRQLQGVFPGQEMINGVVYLKANDRILEGNGFDGLDPFSTPQHFKELDIINRMPDNPLIEEAAEAFFVRVYPANDDYGSAIPDTLSKAQIKYMTDRLTRDGKRAGYALLFSDDAEEVGGVMLGRTGMHRTWFNSLTFDDGYFLDVIKPQN